VSALNQKRTLKNGTWIGVDDAYRELFSTFARAPLEEIASNYKITIVVKEISVVSKFILKRFLSKY